MHLDGTSLTPTQCLVDRNRLLVLGFEFDGKRSVPAIADFRLAHGSLALDKFDLVLDHQASLLARASSQAFAPSTHVLFSPVCQARAVHDGVPGSFAFSSVRATK